MLGTSEYAYVHVDGRHSKYGISARHAQLLSGSLSWAVTSKASPGFARLATLWGTLTPADCTTAGIDPTPVDMFSTDPSDFAGYAYDAVAALALAIDASNVTDWERCRSFAACLYSCWVSCRLRLRARNISLANKFTLARLPLATSQMLFVMALERAKAPLFNTVSSSA